MVPLTGVGIEMGWNPEWIEFVLRPPQPNLGRQMGGKQHIQ